MGTTPPRDARNWQGPYARKNSGRPTAPQSRRPLILGIVFTMLCLGGVLLALFFYLQTPPEPLLVIIRIDQYTDPTLPVSPWGEQDRDALRKTKLKEQGAFSSQERQLLVQELKTLGRNQPTNQPLVIYLSAYGAASKDGVALLPADARLDDPDTWLSFKDVLQAIKDCPVKHRLLLLDLAQPSAVARGGLPANDVAQRLVPILDTAVANDPGLRVLTSCSPGQVSLSSEELGHTVFAHFVAKGLLGHADGCLPGKPADHRVSVQELQTYVRTQVDRWAWHNRNTRQTPAFFGAADDSALTTVETPSDPASTPLPVEYPVFLQNGWKEQDLWRKDHSGRTPAELYRRLQNDTLLAEEHWRGGDNESKVQSTLDPQVQRLRERRRNEKVGNSVEPRSLAQAVAAGQALPSGAFNDAVRDLRELATLYALAKKPNPNEKDEARFTKETERIRAKYGPTPFDLAWTVIAVAIAEAEPRAEQLRCWHGLLQTESQSPPDFAETRFLKRLADWKVEKPTDWPAAAFAGALQLTVEAEKVEAGNPQQLQTWIKNDYDEAAKQRQLADDLLFNDDPAKRAGAPKVIEAALNKYRALSALVSTLNDAISLRDEGQIYLPAYSAFLEFDATNLSNWKEAARATFELNDALSRPAAGSLPQETRGRLRELVTTLRNSLKKLRQPTETAWVRGPIDERQPVNGPMR
jgi:hypothetical protein